MNAFICLFIFIYLYIVTGENTYEPSEKRTETYSKYQLRGMYKPVNFMGFYERLIKLYKKRKNKKKKK